MPDTEEVLHGLFESVTHILSKLEPEHYLLGGCVVLVVMIVMVVAMVVERSAAANDYLDLDKAIALRDSDARAAARAAAAAHEAASRGLEAIRAEALLAEQRGDTVFSAVLAARAKISEDEAREASLAAEGASEAAQAAARAAARVLARERAEAAREEASLEAVRKAEAALVEAERRAEELARHAVIAAQLHETKQAALQQTRWQAARRVQEFRTKQREHEQARSDSLAYVEHAAIKHSTPQFPFGGGLNSPRPTLQSPGFVVVAPPPPGWALYSRPVFPALSNLLSGITASISSNLTPRSWRRSRSPSPRSSSPAGSRLQSRSKGSSIVSTEGEEEPTLPPQGANNLYMISSMYDPERDLSIVPYRLHPSKFGRSSERSDVESAELARLGAARLGATRHLPELSSPDKSVSGVNAVLNGFELKVSVTLRV